MKIVFASRSLIGIAAVCAFGLLALLPAGCDNRPNNQEIRQQTADATRDAKQGAKELAKDTRTAAANAVDGVNAVARGVKDGVNGDGKSGGGKAGDNDSDLVDINSASTVTIATLPGVSLTKAHDIVKGRPYDDAHALVRRGLLTQAQYDRIAPKVVAK